MHKAICSTALLLLLLPACATLSSLENSNLDADLVALQELRQAELHAFNTGDIEAYLSLLSEDIVFDSWNHPAVVGFEESAKLMEILFAKATFYATYDPKDVVVEGNLAFDRGLWYERMTLKSNGVTTNEIYGTLQVYRKGKNGRWALGALDME